MLEHDLGRGGLARHTLQLLRHQRGPVARGDRGARQRDRASDRNAFETCLRPPRGLSWARAFVGAIVIAVARISTGEADEDYLRALLLALMRWLGPAREGAEALIAQPLRLSISTRTPCSCAARRGSANKRNDDEGLLRGEARPKQPTTRTIKDAGRSNLNDLAQFSVVRTLRDGPRMEDRAQRPQDREGLREAIGRASAARRAARG